MWRRHVGVAAKVTFAAYAAAEVTAFVGHQRRIARAENAPTRRMDPNFDVKAHASWFARELRREPNP